jgi:TRAP-type mannitol/chloroaromatic compound transport system permease large subunit
MSVALILILGRSLLGSRINTSAGSATVSGAMAFAPNAHDIRAYIYTYFLRKTGRVYVGISSVSSFIVWYLAGFSVFAVTPQPAG